MNPNYRLFRLLISLLFVLLLMPLLSAQNEVVVNPVISPPYSPYLYDYQDQLILTLVNQTERNLRIKLQGRLENDQGMAVFTKPEFLPAQAIELAPLEVKTLFASSESEGFLDRRNIEVMAPQRIQQNILRTGILPEGNYQFCIQAIDYESNTPLSQEAPSGCLFFPLSRLQPPSLIYPSCGSDLQNEWPVFTWSPPIGNTVGADFRYDLYLLRLYPGQNANDAMNRAVDYRAGNPIIIEDVIGNSYAYQPGDQPLERGATYAVQIIARDPEERLAFVNNGRSEVCLLNFQADETSRDSIPLSGGLQAGEMTLVAGTNLPFNMPSAMVSGQLLYQFPYPKRVNNNIPTNSVMQYQGALTQPTFATMSETVAQQGAGYSSSQQASLIDENLAATLAQYEPDYSQPIFFGPQVTPNNPLPLPNTRVNLVLRYVQLNANVDGEFQPYHVIPPGQAVSPNLFGDDPNGLYYNGKIMASATTDENGNYSLQFMHFDSLYATSVNGVIINGQEIDIGHNGTLQGVSLDQAKFLRVLRLEIDNPYFASPDLNILIQPNQGLILPEQIALVKAYNLKVAVRSNNDEGQIAGKNQPLAGVMVDIRKDAPYSSIQHFTPTNEGQDIDESVIDIGGNYPMVASKETNSQGEALITHLVGHYATQLTDRYFNKAYTKETNTSYIYHKQYFRFPDAYEFPYINMPPPDAPYPFVSKVDADQLPLYNSEVRVETYDETIIMRPDKPKVFGRVMHATEPIKQAVVSLRKTGQVLPIAYTLTDEEGYFSFEDLEPGSGYSLRISHSGYLPLYVPLLNGQVGSFSLVMGEFKNFQQLYLQPLGQVKGYLVNEAGNPLMADVKIGTGPWQESQWMPNPGSLFSQLIHFNQTEGGADFSYTNINTTFLVQQAAGFITQAQSGTQIPIIIDPHSDQYFRDTFYVDIAISANTQDLGTFVLKERLHRVVFRISNLANASINGAKVYLEDSLKIANSLGLVSYVFPSAGNYFLLRVEPPPGSNLAPFQDYVHIPVTKDWHLIKIVLRPAVTINGVVTAGPDHTPLANARVFIEDNTTIGEGLPLVETYSAADGSYTLEGVPLDTLFFHGMMQGTPISFAIHAVKSDPDIVYVGTSSTVFVPPSGPVNLHLDVVEGVDGSQLLGFPIEIESYTPGADGQAVISGAFVDLEANANFALKMDNFRLPFHDIPVALSTAGSGQTTPVMEPMMNRVPITINTVPLRIYAGFQGELRPSIGGYSQNGGISQYNWQDIAVQKVSPGKGILRGAVFLELESFKFTYQYTGDFYLGSTPDNFQIDAFKPATESYPERSFHVADRFPINGNIIDLQFSIHEFPAHADRSQSTIQGDTVRLYTVLHTNIALSDPPDLAIEAGEIKITPQEILPFSQGDALSFQLEEWEVVSQTGWFYDKINGGLHIPQATIKTGYVDVPIENLVIRYDDLNEPDIVLNDPNQPFRLAGVADLTITGSNPVLHYDNMSITDLQPHWIIEILGTANTPAATTSLPHVQQPVEFNSFQLVSNGTVNVNVPVQQLRVYDIMDVLVTGLSTGPDFFHIQGSGNLHIPGLNNDLSTILAFTRTGDQVELAINPLTMEVAGAGKVFFNSHTGQNDQQFQNGSFTAYGHFSVEDQAGNAFTLQGQLTKTNTLSKIDIIDVNNQHQQIVCGNAGSNALEVFDGSMMANLNSMQWNFLEFDAKPVSSKGLASDTKVMHFTVYGDIEASDETIKMEGFDLGFAKMELTFNIADMTLTGTLQIGGGNSPPLTIGVATVKQGQFSFLMSDNGFYFLFGGEVFVPVVGDIGVCILVGHYSTVDQVMRDMLETYAYQNAFPEAFNNGFSGFLVNGFWEPVDAGVDESLLNFSVNVYVQLGVEVRLAADFQDGYYLFSCLGYGAAGVGVSFDLLVCDIGIAVDVVLEILAKTEIQNDNFTFTGCASLAMGLAFDACLASYCWSNSIRLIFTMDTDSGVDFDASLGETCSGNDPPLGVNQGSGASDSCN